MKADLHLHTTASDGVVSPREIVRKASELGLEVIAITDHDTVDGVPDAIDEAGHYPGLLVIPGVEINTDLPGGEAHVLGYYMDCNDSEFTRALSELRDSRRERARKILAKLADMGIPVGWEEVVEQAAGGAIGRPHIARAMQERGYVASLRGAFAGYLGRNAPAYVERKRLGAVEAVELVVKAGGLAVLAHPADIENLEALILQLKRAGLAGIEIYYANYSPATIERLQALAKTYDLIASGGSDYHGLDKSIGTSIGSVDLPRDVVEQLVSLGERKRMVIP